MTLIRAHLILLFTGALAAILVVRKRHKSNTLQRDTLAQAWRSFRARLALPLGMMALVMLHDGGIGMHDGTLTYGKTAEAQAARPDTVPAACRDMPLPSAMPFALDQYEARLHAFLEAQCYIHLGWTHDARVRDTGP